MMLDDLLNSSLRPSLDHVRMVMAAVFDRDIGVFAGKLKEESFNDVEIVIVLAAKMLLDMGYSHGHVQTICRRSLAPFKECCLDTVECPASLNVFDNRYTSVSGSVRRGDERPRNRFTRPFDYTTGMAAAPQGLSGPLLVMSINVTKLLQIARQGSRDSRAEAAVPPTAGGAGPFAP